MLLEPRGNLAKTPIIAPIDLDVLGKGSRFFPPPDGHVRVRNHLAKLASRHQPVRQVMQVRELLRLFHHKSPHMSSFAHKMIDR